MANVIYLKRSSVPGKIPTISDLALGELGLNTFDGKIFIKQNNGTEQIIELSGAQSSSGTDWWNADIVSGFFFTDLMGPIISSGFYTANSGGDDWDDVVTGGYY